MKKIITPSEMRNYLRSESVLNNASDALLQKIHSMDMHTAYALLGGYLAPLLNTKNLEKTTRFVSLKSPSFVSTLSPNNISPSRSPVLKNNQTIRELEGQLRKILDKFKEYVKMNFTGEEQLSGDLETEDYNLSKKYTEIYEEIEKLREIISSVGWRVPRKEVKAKFTELLALFLNIKTSGSHIGGSSPRIYVIMTQKEAKERIQDIEKALKSIYENREEKEEKALKELEKRVDDLTKNKDETISELKDKIEGLENQEKTIRLRITSLEQKVLELENKQGVDQKEIAQKDRQIKNLREEINTLEQEKINNKATIDKLTKEVTGFKGQITALEKTKTDNEATIRKLNKEIDDFKEQITELERERDNKVIEITGKESEIAKLNKEIDDFKKQITELERERDNKVIEITGKETDIADLKEKIDGLEGQITDLERERDEKTDQINERDGKITQLEREKSEKDVEIAGLKKDLQDNRDKLDRITGEKDTAISNLQEEVAEKDLQITTLNKEIAALRENLKNQDDLEQQITDLQKEKEELEKSKGGQITDLQGKLDKLNERISELEALKEAQITALQKDLKKVQEELEQREKEIRDKKIDEIGEKELPDLEKLLRDLEKEGMNLEDLYKLRDKLDNLNKLTKDEKEGVKSIEDLQKDIEALRDALLEQKLKEIEKKKKEQEIIDQEEKLDQLNLQILQLREELGNLEGLKGKDLKNFREKLDDLDGLKGKVGDSKDKIESLEKEVQELRRELLKEKKDEIDKQTKLKEGKEEVKRKEDENKVKEVKEIELEELKKKQGMMDAYIFMIVVFLTHLHTKQAEKLKVHGETMKQISTAFDQWNAIQNAVITLSRNGKTIVAWIKEGKANSAYDLFTDNTLSRKETDPNKLAIWNSFRSLLSTLEQKVRELRNVLDTAKKTLPPSAHSLLNTLYKLSEKILDIPQEKTKNDLSSFLKVTGQSSEESRILGEIEALEGSNTTLKNRITSITNFMDELRTEIGIAWNMSDSWVKTVYPDRYAKKQEWNRRRDTRDELLREVDDNNSQIQAKNRELRQARREKVALPDKRLTMLDWITDNDQTKFKTYMDTFAQGITALTSISNMTQQELHIDTQYYNSLLGLQKAGFDSLNKTIQGILGNMRG